MDSMLLEQIVHVIADAVTEVVTDATHCVQPYKQFWSVSFWLYDDGLQRLIEHPN